MTKRVSPAPSAPAKNSSAGKVLPATCEFGTASSWEAWLQANHHNDAGVWLKISKKGSPTPTVTYDEALDCALCFGWIDGQRKRHNEHYFIQRFTPRRKGSMWSKRNVGKAEQLMEAGRVRAPGLAEIDSAKADGRWQRAYAGSSTIQVPPDFEAALGRNMAAREFFDSLNKGQRYPFLFRLESAKLVDTRARRITQFIALLATRKTL
jgi:uncharacterized protein YdeI (YjbR/CyaY-like superfamily)